MSVIKKIRGFTLVEIQIALFLLVLIMGLLFGALYLTSKSWRTGQAQNELIEEKRLVAEFLRRQISQISPLYWADPNGHALIFRGDSDSILYVGKLPANRNSGELSLLNLTTQEDDSGKQLKLSYGILSPDQTPFKTPDDKLRHTLVLDKIRDLQFEYFGKQKLGKKEPEWSDRWESKKLLPKIIKCQITMENDDQWPEMIFPVHADNTKGFIQLILRPTMSSSSSDNKSSKEQDDDDIDLF